MSKFKGTIPDLFFYDNACNFRKYVLRRTNKSERAKRYEDTKIIVDKLHIRGHKGDYCRENCHLDLYPACKPLNSVICEQRNFWLGRYKHALKHMTYFKFHFFLYIICDAYNEINKRGSGNELWC